MHRMRSVGALVAAAAVGVAVWLLSPAFACSPGATLTPVGVAVPGGQITVEGTVFNPAAGEAKIWWKDVNGLLLGRAQPDSDGRFVTVIDIPATAVPGDKVLLRATQVGTSGPSEPNEVVVSSPAPPPASPPLTSTATVTEPTPPVAASPVPQQQDEVASTPLTLAAPVATAPATLSPLPLTESAGVDQEISARVLLPNPVAAAGSGLLLGQPASSPIPAIASSDDVAGPGVAVVGAPAVVGTPGQPGVVLGTPPPTDFGASRTSTPLVVAASVLGLALLGLGAELARRRATAQA